MNKFLVIFLVIITLGVSWFAFQEKPEEKMAINKEEPVKVKMPKYKKSPEEKKMGPKASPNAFFWEMRAYPKNDIDLEQYRKGREQAKALKQKLLTKDNPKSWEYVGPDNIGGRISDAVIDELNEDNMWALAASGGVWKSTDHGDTWNPVFDDEGNMIMGAIALDPTDSDIAYVGTGEASASSFSFYGNGMYKTIDGGETWEHIGLEDVSYISRVRVDPQNPQIVWVCATGKMYSTDENRGVFKSINGGETWEKVLYVSDKTAANDIVIDPQNSNIVYATMWERIRTLDGRVSGGVNSGIFKTTDGGENWEKLTNGFPENENVGRIGITISRQNPNKLYSVYAKVDQYGSNPLGGVYKTENGGESWEELDLNWQMEDMYSSFGWYFSKIEADPKDDDVVHVLGVEWWKSDNGGDSWTCLGDYDFGPHVDHHALAFSLTSNFVLEGNDGGLIVSNNGGSSYEEKNFGITQFYDIEVYDNDADIRMGGSQDNGTWLVENGGVNYTSVLGGDGFRCIVVPGHPDIMFAEYQNGGMYRITNLGSGYFDYNYLVYPMMEDDRWGWNTPMVLQPLNPNIIYCGSQFVYKSDDVTAGISNFEWEVISPDLSKTDSDLIYSIAPAPSNEDVIYAGTTMGNVWVTQNGGTDWVNITTGLPDRWVAGITVDYENPARAFIAYSGLRWDSELRYVFKTEDYGQTWEDVTNNLPDLPLNCIQINKDDSDMLVVGSDDGVYYTRNSGGEWHAAGLGLPTAPVHDIKLHFETGDLYAGTYGRSMYKIPMNDLTGINDNPQENLDFVLLKNYPNPFNPETTIEFKLDKAQDVSLVVYNAAGRQIAEVFKGRTSAEKITFNAGELRLASGVYIMRLKGENFIKTSKINYIK